MNARLGGLRWSGPEQAWVATTSIDGKPVGVYIRRWDEPQPLPDEQVEATLRAIELAAGNGAELKLAAADELLETFNESWRAEQPVHTPGDFIARLSLQTIDVEPDASRATFAYDDGGLFRGHTIRVDFVLEEMSVDDVSI